MDFHEETALRAGSFGAYCQSEAREGAGGPARGDGGAPVCGDVCRASGRPLPDTKDGERSRGKRAQAGPFGRRDRRGSPRGNNDTAAHEAVRGGAVSKKLKVEHRRQNPSLRPFPARRGGRTEAADPSAGVTRPARRARRSPQQPVPCPQRFPRC